MKYINDRSDFIEEIEVDKETNFNKNGAPVRSDKENIFAKIVVSQNDKSNYFINTYKNEIFDPIGINSKRKNLETKLKRVSKETFDFYLIYLQTNNSIYLTRANRRFINE